MPLPSPSPHTTGSTSFSPAAFFTTWSTTPSLPQHNDLLAALTTAFALPSPDTYVYHATASVTLAQVQSAIAAGSAANLHAWYRSPSGEVLPPPPLPDIHAYTALFAPSSHPLKSLANFALNAKKSSLRALVAAHLHSLRLLPPFLAPPRTKHHVNPYYDFWAWSCACLEWAGPEPSTALVKTSHHVLPVFMHHFGCVVPSWEALGVIKRVAAQRAVVEVGSGNGYWAYMLRRESVAVTAVDSMQSAWRTTWIGDTVVQEGERYLQAHEGCREAVLLLVYPVVGAAFMARVVGAYQGETIVVAGTQNGSGYTGFRDRTVAEWMVERGGWERVVQIALPSFAGKDEALFVFERRRERG